MRRQPRIDRLLADEARLTLVDDAETLLKPHARRLLADDVMRQPMQCAHAIFEQRLKRVIKEAFDARFEIIHRRVDERDDEHFLIVAERAALNDLRRQRREDMRLPRARDGGNAQPPAIIAEDVLLGGTRSESVHFLLTAKLAKSAKILLLLFLLFLSVSATNHFLNRKARLER